MMRPRMIIALLAFTTATFAEAQVPARPAQARAPQASATSPFKLNAQEQAYLDMVLDAWEVQSSKIQTFSCPFVRYDYNLVFGPGAETPMRIEQGELSYQQPDKGSFRITNIKQWQAKSVAPGTTPQKAQGDYIEPAGLVGDHWVCDGKSLYEYKHDQKQLVVRNIPAEMQGKEIVNGPLPFLFGAKSADLKQRYWMMIKKHPDPNMIQLVAAPRYQIDAANYKGVELMLDRQKMLPIAMNVVEPTGSRKVYRFDLTKVSVNSRITSAWNALFSAPRTPFGWKRVEEAEARQATNPTQPAR